MCVGMHILHKSCYSLVQVFQWSLHFEYQFVPNKFRAVCLPASTSGLGRTISEGQIPLFGDIHTTSAGTTTRLACADLSHVPCQW